MQFPPRPEPMLLYPQAYLAMDSGDLVQVTNFKLSFTNGGRIFYTMRGWGYALGKREVTISFTFVIDEAGMERNYLQLVAAGTLKSLRAKLPGLQLLSLVGVFVGIDLDAPLEDATSGSASFVGRLSA